MIRFTESKAIKHLLENGFVYTLRQRSESRRSSHEALSINGKREGNCRIACAVEGPLETSHLEKFVARSGFDSVEDWKSTAEHLHRGCSVESLWIYRVDIE